MGRRDRGGAVGWCAAGRLRAAAVVLALTAGLLVISSLSGPARAASLSPDIPTDLLPVYQAAARTCPGLSWSVLAGIGKVESNHGRSTAPGVHSGSNSAGAMGPMQFLQPTWDRFQTPAPDHVTANVYDPEDAIYTAANYLCHLGAATTDPIRLRQAIYGYNHSWAYVDNVLAWAATYLKNPTVAFSDAQPVAQLTLGPVEFGRLMYDTVGHALYVIDGYLNDLLQSGWGQMVVGEDNLQGGKQVGGVLLVDNSRLLLVWEVSLGIALGSILVLIVTVTAVAWITEQFVSLRHQAARGLAFILAAVALMAASYFLVMQLIAIDNGLVEQLNRGVTLQLQSLPAWQGIGLQDPNTISSLQDLRAAIVNLFLMLAVVLELAVLVAMYFVRVVLIWILVAVAPFAFAAGILPGGMGVVMHWVRLTIATVFFKFINTLVFLAFVFMAGAGSQGLYNELLVLGMLLFMILVPRILMRALSEPRGLAVAVRSTVSEAVS
ncbi:MAG: lytic transglycosylase domain-containing protein [Candidatus Dormibacteraeota bacterium]|nr:lytic transglycosylase domain-containing protein [Candidatus Dormibacteraeota bacterium]